MKYRIIGTTIPAVEIKFDAPGETMYTQSGGMSWMSEGISMSTNTRGGFMKGLGRMFAGESAFQNRYTAERGEGIIAFASSFPGTILPIEITPGKSIIAQKSSFLAGTEGVDLSIFFEKKMGSGFFGGEGFIMQKISGSGLVFLEIDGSVMEYDLEAGQQMVVDTGYLAMMDDTCTMDVASVKGAKNMIFGGEGLFNTVVTGPGKIVLQTMPINSVAGAIIPFIPQNR